MKTKYIGTDTDQVCWGNNDDPRDYLTIGTLYEIADKDVHDWHTKYILDKFPDKTFNSVSFEDVVDD